MRDNWKYFFYFIKLITKIFELHYSLLKEPELQKKEQTSTVKGDAKTRTNC